MAGRWCQPGGLTGELRIRATCKAKSQESRHSVVCHVGLGLACREGQGLRADVPEKGQERRPLSLQLIPGISTSDRPQTTNSVYLTWAKRGLILLI